MDLSSARNFQKIGYIFVIIGAVVDLLLIPETFGFAIILCIISITGAVKLSAFGKYSDQEFVENKGTLLFWGILTLITSIVGGIFTLIAYSSIPNGEVTATTSTSSATTANNNEPDNGLTIEKAFELKKAGALTDEEFQQIKNKYLNN
ncbi:SHOCT domain-containing protein [Limosilactobacillus reuteri]|uniref:SHOCT domain-containing protein n=1 Tax=Limosilactobacillus reuteri TaxID=1598 RepID=UPI001E3C451B|nr:SHOCT domain-containing protein [Limosilactobacillus reuteri]MCC4371617.1 SHOCT domain-containing protein [Limosilactobacillus reuteri]MCC4411651.1 SHOCT domain-containing protein [Limosilactobacillus reuteri]MCC4422311.1 SHOCT domain-containing protein [Limosilactobacillus reuteri]